MKNKFWVLLSIVIILTASHNAVLAAAMGFSIKGTYGETLKDKTGNFTLFSLGDEFSIQGIYDTQQQPEMETKSNGNIPYNDIIDDPNFPYFISTDYSKIINLPLNNILIDKINQYYPSDNDAFESFEIKNDLYISSSNFKDWLFGTPLAEILVFNAEKDYTELILKKSTDLYNNIIYYDGYINYNFHKELIPDGENFIDIRINDTIPLYITEFETFNTNPVPEPSTFLLLCTFIAGFAGLKMYGKIKNK